MWKNTPVVPIIREAQIGGPGWPGPRHETLFKKQLMQKGQGAWLKVRTPA
jgi:hypothetical protein